LSEFAVELAKYTWLYPTLNISRRFLYTLSSRQSIWIADHVMKSSKFKGWNIALGVEQLPALERKRDVAVAPDVVVEVP
jgi:hypothetical protein